MERLAGRVILLCGWQRQLVAFLGGAVASLALAPVDFPAAGFIAFPLLVWLLDGAAASGGWIGRAFPFFVTGWWFGFGYFLAGMWWLGAGLFGRDADHALALPFAVLGIPAVLALTYGLAALAARPLWSDGIGRIASLAFGFGLAEWLRSALLSGLAWNAIGYAAMPVPLLMQAADLVGVFGISALAVFVFSTPALLGTRKHAQIGIALAALLVAAQLGYGYFRLGFEPPADRSLAVRIVQPSADGRTTFDEAFNAYLALSGSPATEGEPRAQLILWPELAVPFVLSERPDLLEAAAQLTGEGQTLVAGAVRSEGTGAQRRLYDAAVAITSGGIVNASDKVHLLPFARCATAILKILGMEMDFGQYAAGSSRRLLNVADGVEALPLIGTEAVIPGIAAREGAGAEIIVNPANYSAFTGTPGPHQHLRQVQIQAVEARLPVLVAMPNGLSSAIDSRGRILESLGKESVEVVDFPVFLSNLKVTNDGNINTLGLTIVIIFAMLALLLSIRWGTN